MKVGAYQFAITSNIEHNMKIIKSTVVQASLEKVKLLIFPECALTGYPPHDIENPSKVDFKQLDLCYEQLQEMAINYDICIIVGTIIRENDTYFNSAIAFSPSEEKVIYHKRALWGWDKEHFCIGNNSGILKIDGMKIGIRICFEVRFPEFFRELYREKTDLNIILFYDVSDKDDIERYEIIKSHIRTRAVENVCYTLTVDTIYPYQTAPTALFDRSGYVLKELHRNIEGLLIYDLSHKQLDFGEQGRKSISDFLVIKEC